MPGRVEASNAPRRGSGARGHCFSEWGALKRGASRSNRPQTQQDLRHEYRADRTRAKARRVGGARGALNTLPSTGFSRPIHRGPRFRVGASATLRGPQLEARGKAAAQQEQGLLRITPPTSTAAVNARFRVLKRAQLIGAQRAPLVPRRARSGARWCAATELCQAPTLGKRPKRKKERDRDRPREGSPRVGSWATLGENGPHSTRCTLRRALPAYPGPKIRPAECKIGHLSPAKAPGS